MISYFLLVLFIILTGFKSSGKPFNNEVIQLVGKREICVDHYLIDKLEGTSIINIIVHKPHEEGAVLYFDKLWEGNFPFYSTIMKDGELYKA